MVAEGMVQLTWTGADPTSGGNSGSIIMSFVEGGNLQGVTDIGRSLSKSPISVPIPWADAIGFDIGLTESDMITIHAIFYDGWGGAIKTLIDCYKYRGGTKSLLLEMGANFSKSVTFNSLSANMTMGHGNEINCSMTFGVIALNNS